LVQLIPISLTSAFAATSHCAAQHKVSGPLLFSFDSRIEALAPPAGLFQYRVNAETLYQLVNAITPGREWYESIISLNASPYKLNLVILEG
jgi:hypothetical protein